MELRCDLRQQLVRWVGAANVPMVRRAEVANVFRQADGRTLPREYAQVSVNSSAE
jgi:hypothetical protein